jgi:RNA-directed DNA polymerase
MENGRKVAEKRGEILEAIEDEIGRNPKGSSMSANIPTSGNKESMESTTKLMEQLVARPNMMEAYKRVTQNKGAAGTDNISTEELKDYLQERWNEIKEELLSGEYQPQPVRRVEIPKPNGGIRKLGIPCVIDRLIQQALNQILSPIFEVTFSQYSYGFRPGRTATQAVKRAKGFIEDGKRWVVDIDLEKFFDKVNHDLLMERIRRKIKDKRILTLIRRYLKAGVMENGITKPNEEGTPQGGPLSPLLSNIMLTDLDNELERRKLSYCRYADDCNIYVKSQKAGNRVFKSITNYLEKKLKLKVNLEKSAVDNPWKRKFLGFSFTSRIQTKIRVHEKSIVKLKDKLKELFRIARGCNIHEFIKEKINPVIRGWINYFKHADVYTYAKELDAWIRRRLRTTLWRQWGKVRVKYRKLISMHIEHHQAYMMANSSKGPWRMSGFKTMAEAMPYSYFEKMGLVSMYQVILAK